MALIDSAETSPLIQADLNDRFALSRIELELSLDVGQDDCPIDSDTTQAFIRNAVEECGDELLFFLPTGEDGDPTAVIRLRDGGQDRLVSVMRFDEGFVVIDEDEIAEETVRFARTMIDVFQHLCSDENIVAPLTNSH